MLDSLYTNTMQTSKVNNIFNNHNLNILLKLDLPIFDKIV